MEVIKGWGKEVIFADTPLYCGKFLVFITKSNKMSMHFHAIKDETWTVSTGSFRLSYINTDTAEIVQKIIYPGDVHRNLPLVPHQLEALEDNSVIIEVSTKDIKNDNYRVMPGDSQK